MLTFAFFADNLKNFLLFCLFYLCKSLIPKTPIAMRERRNEISFKGTKDLCRNRRPFEELVGDDLVRDFRIEEVQPASESGSIARIPNTKLSESRVSFGI